MNVPKKMPSSSSRSRIRKGIRQKRTSKASRLRRSPSPSYLARVVEHDPDVNKEKETPGRHQSKLPYPPDSQSFNIPFPPQYTTTIDPVSKSVRTQNPEPHVPGWQPSQPTISYSTPPILPPPGAASPLVPNLPSRPAVLDPRNTLDPFSFVSSVGTVPYNPALNYQSPSTFLDPRFSQGAQHNYSLGSDYSMGSSNYAVPAYQPMSLAQPPLVLVLLRNPGYSNYPANMSMLM